jgi:hypothetical protein
MYPAHLFLFGDMAMAVAQPALTKPVTTPVARPRGPRERPR